MKKVLFIHRSVGRNLLADSNFYVTLKHREVDFELHDFDYNRHTLGNGVKDLKVSFQFAGDNTDPENYAQLFNETVVGAQKSARDFVLAYDVVVIKSCYPNSDIKSEGELAALKSHYMFIAEFFKARPEKHLLILTTPPLVPRKTSQAAAARARSLASWLSETPLAPNVSVFNFFNLLAEPETSKQANTLKKQYRRKLPWDSHPNKLASLEVAPELITFLDELTDIN